MMMMDVKVEEAKIDGFSFSLLFSLASTRSGPPVVVRKDAIVSSDTSRDVRCCVTHYSRRLLYRLTVLTGDVIDDVPGKDQSILSGT
jgi:hypothetical protein